MLKLIFDFLFLTQIFLNAFLGYKDELTTEYRLYRYFDLDKAIKILELFKL